jgi:hypothetical protein
MLPLCARVVIGRQVGEGVPKDRYERELLMNTTSAWCQAEAADICGCGTQMADQRISV